MQSDADWIAKEVLPEECERTKSQSAGFHFFEIAAAKESVEFVRVVPFRLKS